MGGLAAAALVASAAVAGDQGIGRSGDREERVGRSDTARSPDPRIPRFPSETDLRDEKFLELLRTYPERTPEETFARLLTSAMVNAS